jgi:ABC-type nitrate/sulfonate/bicarbonate transport system permease component
MIEGAGEAGLTPKAKLMLALPIIAVLVIILVYLQLFSSPVVIAVIFVAYVVVSLMNRRKFDKQRDQNQRADSGSKHSLSWLS